MKNRVPTIRLSAQAKLLLYKLISSRIVALHDEIIIASPDTRENLISNLESKTSLAEEDKSLPKSLLQIFLLLERSTRRDLERQIMNITGSSLWLGIFPQDLLESFIKEHVQLFKNVDVEYLNKISSVLQRSIRQGLLEKDIAQELRKHTRLSKKRARLIARNAPLQYSGAITKHHQKNAGIKSYIWQTSRDERVRNSHRKFDGEIFNWDSAGPHPRTEVNCRCDAIPFFR